MKIHINDSNYSYYKGVFEIFWSHYKRILPLQFLSDNTDPVSILNNWEKENKQKARRALKESLQDMISQIKEFSPELRISIDNELASNNFPSLRDLQGIISKTLARVLKRKRVNNLEEFYIVKEIVIDESSDITEDQRIIFDRLLLEFEFSKNKGGIDYT